MVAGGLSQHIGRRLTIMWVSLYGYTFRIDPILYASFCSTFVCLAGVFIPLWIIPNTFGKLAVGAFCTQFGIHG